VPLTHAMTVMISRRSTPWLLGACLLVAGASLAACSSSQGDQGGSSTWSDDASSGAIPSGDDGGTTGDDGATPGPDGAPAGDASSGLPVCDDQGSFCGGHGVTGGDPNTLYVCAAKGAAPASASKCTTSCQHEATPPDQCAVVDAGGGQLSCAGKGYYCGGDMLGGDPSTLYYCPGAGAAPSSSQVCANGCQVEPPGTNDLCKSAIVCPTGGDYCGGDTIGGDPSTLYHCTAGGQPPASSQACANGCQTMPQGTNDVCRSTLSCPGSGPYCGSDGVQGGDPNTLYNCPGAGQPPSSSQACANGCTTEPAGTPDFCAATNNCPSAGDYCGNDQLNGPANVLYHCTAAGQPPASSTVCSGGCIVEPQGTNDVCAGSGGCSAQGQAALNWEASQLNSGNSWSDYCLGFVNTAYQNAGMTLSYLQAPDANTSLQEAEGTGRFVYWNGNCPCGAILYWSANSCNGEWGHVVICNGDGTASTSGWPGFGGSTHASISWLDGQECGHTPTGYILP
jgi:hypothetical protein